MIRFLITSLLFSMFCISSSAASPQILVNVTLLSPERSAPLLDAWVRIDEGRITEVGSGPIETSGSDVIDGLGGFLTPGLIDSHVHLYHATGLKRRYTDDFDSLYSDFMDQQPRSFLYHGFTSVIELNADAETNARFEAAPYHPNLYHCGQAVPLSDGFTALELEGEPIERYYPGYLIDHHENGAVPTGADPAMHSPQAIVDYVQQQGGVCIKLYYEEALWWAGGAPEFSLPSLEIVRDVVSAAHARNLPVVLHATTPRGHRFALQADVDILAHGMWEWTGQAFAAPEPTADTAEIATEVALSDMGMQPTFRTIFNTASLFEPDVLTSPAWDHVVPATYLAYLRGNAQQQPDIFFAVFGPQLAEDATIEQVPALMEAFTSRYERLINSMVTDGGSLLFGSDTAVGGFGWASPPGLGGYWEMQDWQRAGVPLQTLFAALTIDNARAFGLDQDLGTIEPGKRADLLILRSNPLEDVTAFDTIDRIILSGEVIARSELSATEQGR